MLRTIRKLTRKDQGMAALEMALLMPMLAMFMYLLVEGGNALKTYNTISEATRAAARHVAINGSTVGASGVIDLIVADLPASNLNKVVTTANNNTVVTIEVSYDYKPFFSANPFSGESGTLLTLKSSSTMPIP